MPLLAAASGVAAATLAALPLTVGFFKDELLFTAAAGDGTGTAVMAVLAAALTFAYIGRFWLGLFTGTRRTEPHRVPALLIAPVGALAALAVAGGLVAAPFARLAEDAGTVTNGAPVALSPAYHLEASTENLMALAAWALGGLLLAAPALRAPLVSALSRAGDVAGPRRLYGAALQGLNRLSDRLHGAEVRDLRTSLAAAMLPGGVLLGIALVATPTQGTYVVGAVQTSDLPVIALLVLTVLAGVAVTRDPGRLRPVLSLSVLGFALAGVYALAGAPDIALVAVVVETMLTLVFVGIFAGLPRRADDRADDRAGGVGRPSPRRRRRNVLFGTVAGLGAFVTVWAALSRPTPDAPVAAELVRRTPEAHGGDVVTVILADFRALDTMVEISVLAVALLGVVSLLRRGRLW
jgi:multicomponent Na+:H+ antiporter subunit A